MRSKLLVSALSVLALSVALIGCAKEEPISVGEINAPESTSEAAAVQPVDDVADTSSSEVVAEDESADESPRRADESVPEIVDAVAAITTVEDYTPDAFEEWKASLARFGVELENENDAKKPFLINVNTSGGFAFGAVLLDSTYERDPSDDKVYVIKMRVSRATSATNGKPSKTITHNITTLLPDEVDAKYLDEMRWTLTLSDGGANAVLRLDTPDWHE